MNIENRKNNKDQSKSFGPVERELLKLVVDTILENEGEAGRQWIVGQLEEKFGKQAVDDLRRKLMLKH